MDGEDRPVKSRRVAPLDATPQKKHQNNENDGVVANAARVDPSKPGGDNEMVLREDEAYEILEADHLGNIHV